MPAVPLKKVFEARRMISSGKSVKEVSKHLKMSESSVRDYTKSERAKLKEAQ